MNRHKRNGALVLALTCLALAGAALAQGQPSPQQAQLAGGADALWLVLHEHESYQLAVKPANRPWSRQSPPYNGGMVTAAATPAGLTVFFDSGQPFRYAIGAGEGQAGPLPPRELWPVGTNVLAAAADGDALLVLVSRPPLPPGAATAPVATRAAARADTGPPTATASPATTRPAVHRLTAPAPVGTTIIGPPQRELVILKLADAQWQDLALVPDELANASTRAQLAVAKGEVYVLLERPEVALLELRKDQWRRIDLPGDLLLPRTATSNAPVPATVALAGGTRPGPATKRRLLGTSYGLYLLAADAGGGSARLARFAGGQWLPVQPVRSADGTPLKLPPAAAPDAAVFLNHLAMAWRDKDRWVWAPLDLEGRLMWTPAPLSEAAAQGGLGEKVRDFYVWFVMGLILGLTLWPDKMPRGGEFSLPGDVQPGRLPRRLLAFVLDVAGPFLIGAAVAGPIDPEVLREAMREVMSQGTMTALPDRINWASPIFFTTYVLYCIIMELRFGATLGKMAMRLRVVAVGGARPTVRQTILRNAWKVPEIAGVLLMVFPLFTRFRQRIGDKFAGTAVVEPTPTVEESGSPDDEQ